MGTNKLTIKYFLVLLAFFILDFLLINFSGLNLMESLTLYFPKELGENTKPLKLYNLILFIGILAILVNAINEYYNSNPTSTILKATLYGTKIFFIVEVVYQLIAQVTIGIGDFDTKIFYYSKAIITTTVLGIVLCFFIAYQRKTKNNWRLTLYIIIFIILFNLTNKIIPLILEKNI
jgi:hypothetical protein